MWSVPIRKSQGNWPSLLYDYPPAILLGPALSPARPSGPCTVASPVFWALHCRQPGLLGPALSPARPSGPCTVASPAFWALHSRQPNLLGVDCRQPDLLAPALSPALPSGPCTVASTAYCALNFCQTNLLDPDCRQPNLRGQPSLLGPGGHQPHLPDSVLSSAQPTGPRILPFLHPGPCLTASFTSWAHPTVTDPTFGPTLSQASPAGPASTQTPPIGPTVSQSPLAGPVLLLGRLRRAPLPLNLPIEFQTVASSTYRASQCRQPHLLGLALSPAPPTGPHTAASSFCLAPHCRQATYWVSYCRQPHRLGLLLSPALPTGPHTAASPTD
jgi:hypothetical protein